MGDNRKKNSSNALFRTLSKEELREAEKYDARAEKIEAPAEDVLTGEKLLSVAKQAATPKGKPKNTAEQDEPPPAKKHKL